MQRPATCNTALLLQAAFVRRAARTAREQRRKVEEQTGAGRGHGAPAGGFAGPDGSGQWIRCRVRTRLAGTPCAACRPAMHAQTACWLTNFHLRSIEAFVHKCEHPPTLATPCLARYADGLVLAVWGS